MIDNHISLAIYLNMDYVWNVVADEHLEEYISYNKTFRPGRLLYVDGKRIHNGCLYEHCLDKYDDFAKKMYAETKINKNNITVPYR
jgi:hypothetical protein